MRWRFWSRRDRELDNLVEAAYQDLLRPKIYPPLTEEQAAELDRRVEAYRQNPNNVLSWKSMSEDIANRWMKR